MSVENAPARRRTCACNATAVGSGDRRPLPPTRGRRTPRRHRQRRCPSSQSGPPSWVAGPVARRRGGSGNRMTTTAPARTHAHPLRVLARGEPRQRPKPDKCAVGCNRIQRRHAHPICGRVQEVIPRRVESGTRDGHTRTRAPKQQVQHRHYYRQRAVRGPPTATAHRVSWGDHNAKS